MHALIRAAALSLPASSAQSAYQTIKPFGIDDHDEANVCAQFVSDFSFGMWLEEVDGDDQPVLMRSDMSENKTAEMDHRTYVACVHKLRRWRRAHFSDPG